MNILSEYRLNFCVLYLGYATMKTWHETGRIVHGRKVQVTR